MRTLTSLLFAAAVSAAALAHAETAAWQAELARARAQQGVLPEEDAAGAVDGNVCGSFSFHTGQDQNPFWQVDLGKVYDLGRVAVYNPHVPERLAGFKLLLSDDGAQWREAYRHEGTPPVGERAGEPFIVPLEAQRGRFVRIQVPGHIWMHLDEVQVFAPGGDTNLALKKPATQSSTSRWSTRSIRVDAEEGSAGEGELARRALDPVLRPLGAAQREFRAELDALLAAGAPLDDPRWANLYARAAAVPQRLAAVRDGLERFSPRAVRMAIDDMASTFPERFADAPAHLDRLSAIEARLPELREALAAGAEGALAEAEGVVAFQRQVLLHNPLLDFDRIVVLQREFPQASSARSAMGRSLGVGSLNSHTSVNIARRGAWADRLAALENIRHEPRLDAIYDPGDGRTIIDPALDFGADRILFAMEGEDQRNWRLFEMEAGGSELRQITPDDGDDVAHFDPCWLADGNVIFMSTAAYMGLPCEFGQQFMVSLFRLDRDTGKVRQLSFDQDSSWSPTPLANGRVLYQRWEYSDIAHSNSRMLCHMNPDGTDQREYWGSGSYFPPSFFYAKPVPDHPRMVIGVAGGHHGTPRSGRLLLVDPALGRREAEGVVQEIPGYGKTVEPIVRDRLVDGVWPQFLHPYPLSSKYHLVAAKPAPGSLWGIYLVDVFDNVTLIKAVEGNALLWPIPLQETRRPPVIPERVDVNDPEGRLLVVDVYEGDGLAGIPRGTVAALRIFEYYFSYRGTGGLLGSIGMDGPWDIKRVLGTVPVEPDGSAYFTVPANTPISIQALDRDGQALQLMRSWTVVQPGENASCIGCHESQNESPPLRLPAAAMRRPSRVQATWQAPERGFSFEREVQPVLDRHCAGCHDGSPRADGHDILYLKADRRFTDWSSRMAGNAGGRVDRGRLESYAQLHRYLRRPGIESDIRMLSPMDYHFSATELGQMLRKGHHGVRLDAESWDRLVTWFDLNAPYHGTWGEIVGHNSGAVANLQRAQERALQLRHKYAPHGAKEYEHVPDLPPFDTAFVPPATQDLERAPPPAVAGWPFDAEEAKRRQADAARAARLEGGPKRSIDLGEGPLFPTAYLGHDDTRPAVEPGPVRLDLVLVPGGRFVMGSSGGHPDEYPYTAVEVEPFWMARFEVSNALYRMFDPRHESRDESRHGYQFGRRGFYQDAPGQPAVRVSWNEARAFCEWLSERTGLTFDLPTEAQWEWAARAGAATAFHFGDLGDDYSPYANLADRKLQQFAQCTAPGGYTRAVPIANPNRYDDWIPRCNRYDDGALVTVDAGSYLPNPWGLHDMHGNAAEWTRSAYLPYPYRAEDGRNDPAATDPDRVARGGSWRDRPHQSTASYRRPYRPYHRVFNVGFRVVAPLNPAAGANGD